MQSVLRRGWIILASLTVVLFLCALPGRYEDLRTLAVLDGTERDEVLANLAQLGVSIDLYAGYHLALAVAFAVACFALAVLIFWRRHDEPIALFVALMLVLLGAAFPGTLDGLQGLHPILDLLGNMVDALSVAFIFLFFYIFPNGRFVPRWTRWLAGLLLVWTGAMIPRESPLNPENWPDSIYGSVMVGLLLTGVVAQIYRYRRVSGPTERQQTKWVVFGFAVGLAGYLGLLLLSFRFPSLRPGTLADIAIVTGIYCLMLLVPLSLAIAILRYRLWDIDVIINRTLVYGSLTASVVGIYVLLVVSLGTLLQAHGSFLVALLATGLIAVLFAPLRDRLQRGVNHLMYGERDDPYKVLSGLGERLETTLAPHAVLPALTETVAGALKLPYAAITLKHNGDGLVQAAEYGRKLESDEELLSMPLTYQKEIMGELLLAPRSPGEAFSKQDLHLLEDLSRQIGVAAYAVRLTADLQRSRERLVMAREEERRRLRRDLHDGVGPQLAALMLELETASELVSENPEASSLIAKLSERTRETVSDIRRSVHALRPPSLDELGLVGALRETAAQYNRGGLHVSVDAPEELPPLPAAVEVACYRIAQEAMTNVVRHAQAKNCSVRIALDEEARVLSVEVEDDGRGIDDNDRAGVGMSSMRERAEELGGRCSVVSSSGGGTCLRAILPCRVTDSREE